MHPKQLVKLLSAVTVFLSIVMLIPLIVALIHNESREVTAFVLTIVPMSVIGLSAYFLTRKDEQPLSQTDGFLFTTFTWIIAATFGAVPFVLSGVLPEYSNAFFEVISGLTTTGASRITDVESCPRSILFWRSLTNWLGGMGIVVLFVALLPALGATGGSFNLIGAESVGPVKGKLTPKTKNTAVVLYLIYFAMTVLEVLLLLPKMDLFNAVTLAFSTVSTAGFSIRNASVGSYNSAYVDYVVTAFMLAASVNFSLYYRAFTGHLKQTLKDTEFRTLLSVFMAAAVAGAVMLCMNNVYPSFAQAFRYMSFHVASVVSTTGFSNAASTYLSWPSFCIMILVLMMFIGGSAGSTGGGMKIIRIVVLFKSARTSIKRKIHPNSMFRIKISNGIVDDSVVFQILAFCATYMITWLAGATVISFSGAGIQDSLSASILTLGNIGLGFGHKDFSSYPLWTNWIFSFLMLAGRLELFTVYVLFSKSFWRS